ncbi:MAG: hypothetical protein ABIY58_07180 [Acidimicrobiales bacterium]
MTVFGAGLAGTATVTGAWSAMLLVGSLSPLSVWSVPPVIVTEPVAPASEAVHVLDALVAVNTSWAEVLMLVMLVELVTDPVGPVVPWVLTVIGPELKKRAGPAEALPVAAVAVRGTADPPAGSVTVGVGPTGGWAIPNRLALREYPKALPVTADTSASAPPCPRAATSSAAADTTRATTPPRLPMVVRACPM